MSIRTSPPLGSHERESFFREFGRADVASVDNVETEEELHVNRLLLVLH